MVLAWLIGLANAQALPDGLEIGSTYTGELWGSSNGGVAHAGMADLTLFADLEPLAGVPGMSVYGHGLLNHSSAPSTLLGDAQWTSNIEAPNGAGLYELWLEQRIEGVSLKLGVQELNNDFDTNDAALVFLHSSQGLGPELSSAGVNGPSTYPLTALTGRLRVDVSRSWAQVALSDGIPAGRARIEYGLAGDGLLAIGEVGTTLEIVELTAGAWDFTTSGAGVYGMAEVRHLPDGDKAGVLASLRAGAADPRHQRFPYYVGGSFALEGLLRPLPGDTLGLAVSTAMTGAPARVDGALPAEVAVELTWKLGLTRWAFVQPDLQYVLYPGADPAKSSGLLAALRVFVSTPPPPG